MALTDTKLYHDIVEICFTKIGIFAETFFLFCQSPSISSLITWVRLTQIDMDLPRSPEIIKSCA